MSCACNCLRGVSRWFTRLACGPGHPELSKSYMDVASKLFAFTFTCPFRAHACTCDHEHSSMVSANGSMMSTAQTAVNIRMGNSGQLLNDGIIRKSRHRKRVSMGGTQMADVVSKCTCTRRSFTKYRGP